jgi:hypothetical protein
MKRRGSQSGRYRCGPSSRGVETCPRADEVSMTILQKCRYGVESGRWVDPRDTCSR